MNLHVRSLLIYIITMAGRLERGEKIFLFVYSELGYTKKKLVIKLSFIKSIISIQISSLCSFFFLHCLSQV